MAQSTDEETQLSHLVQAGSPPRARVRMQGETPAGCGMLRYGKLPAFRAIPQGIGRRGRPSSRLSSDPAALAI